jgi:hypothetical protein
LLGRRAN